MEKQTEKSTIFLCPASEDKLNATEIYHKLKAKGFDTWLDTEYLLPGSFGLMNYQKLSKHLALCLSFF